MLINKKWFSFPDVGFQKEKMNQITQVVLYSYCVNHWSNQRNIIREIYLGWSHRNLNASNFEIDRKYKTIQIDKLIFSHQFNLSSIDLFSNENQNTIDFLQDYDMISV